MSRSRSYATEGRLAGLLEALRRLLERPWHLLAGLLGGTLALASLLVATALLWRIWPPELPPGAQAQALVLVAGGEGETDLAAVRATLAHQNLVQGVDFVGRDAALAELAQRKGLSGLGLSELRPNPLPDTFVVRFDPAASAEAVEQAVAGLRHLRPSDTIEYLPEPYRRLSQIVQVGRRLAVALAVLLGLAALSGLALSLICAVVIDREEIAVLQLLGAEPRTQRRPYVYAGALRAALSAALAWGLLLALQAGLDAALAELLQQFALHWDRTPLPTAAGLPFVAGLGLLGALAASLRLRIVQAHSDGPRP